MINKNILSIGVIVVGLAVIFFIGRDMLLSKLNPSPTINPTATFQPILNDLIRIENPEPNQFITSPLVVTGEARGYWYFEASFPVRVYDADGVELSVIPAQAQGDSVGDGVNWMTEEFVPFRAVLEFKKPTTETGTLVLQKDNPSGLPENDAELRIPIRFDLANWPSDSASGGCKVTGCSGQICAEEDVITTCEYRDEYACFKTAKCERQEDGKCGWIPTEELVACLGAVFQGEVQ